MILDEEEDKVYSLLVIHLLNKYDHKSKHDAIDNLHESKWKKDTKIPRVFLIYFNKNVYKSKVWKTFVQLTISDWI